MTAPAPSPAEQPKRLKRGICEHGLNDQVDVEQETRLTNYKVKQRTTIFTYYCREHERHGSFTAKTVL
jgi:hypothetical protein